MNEKYIKAKEEWLSNKNLSATQVAKANEIDRQRFVSFLKREGVWQDRRIKYSYKRDYFKDINSPTKAYLIGFIAADGCILTDENNVLKGLDIGLKKEDITFLEKFCSELEIPRELIKPKNNGQAYFVRLISKEIAANLFNVGIIPRKSLTLNLAEVKISEEYYQDFIRGYFDGDGCFTGYYNSHGKFCGEINFTGTKESLDFVRTFIKDAAQSSLGSLVKRHSDRNNNNYTVIWQGNQQVKRICEVLLSSNSTLLLERKQNKMLKFIQNN